MRKIGFILVATVSNDKRIILRKGKGDKLTYSFLSEIEIDGSVELEEALGIRPSSGVSKKKNLLVVMASGSIGTTQLRLDEIGEKPVSKIVPLAHDNEETPIHFAEEDGTEVFLCGLKSSIQPGEIPGPLYFLSQKEIATASFLCLEIKEAATIAFEKV